MAPFYANIFMSRLENLLQSVSLKPHTWLRFIDDIDMKWCHGRDSLQDFLHKANTFHPPIKFTAEISNNEHFFLDTKSHIQNDIIVVDLHTKPTDSHLYLLPYSGQSPVPTSVQRTVPCTYFRTTDSHLYLYFRTAVTLNTVLKIFHTA